MPPPELGHTRIRVPGAMGSYIRVMPHVPSGMPRSTRPTAAGRITGVCKSSSTICRCRGDYTFSISNGAANFRYIPPPDAPRTFRHASLQQPVGPAVLLGLTTILMRQHGTVYMQLLLKTDLNSSRCYFQPPDDPPSGMPRSTSPSALLCWWW